MIVALIVAVIILLFLWGFHWFMERFYTPVPMIVFAVIYWCVVVGGIYEIEKYRCNNVYTTDFELMMHCGGNY